MTIICTVLSCSILETWILHASAISNTKRMQVKRSAAGRLMFRLGCSPSCEIVIAQMSDDVSVTELDQWSFRPCWPAIGRCEGAQISMWGPRPWGLALKSSFSGPFPALPRSAWLEEPYHYCRVCPGVKRICSHVRHVKGANTHPEFVWLKLNLYRCTKLHRTN